MVLKCGLKADSNNGYFSEFSVYEGRTESALTSQNTRHVFVKDSRKTIFSHDFQIFTNSQIFGAVITIELVDSLDIYTLLITRIRL